MLREPSSAGFAACPVVCLVETDTSTIPFSPVYHTAPLARCSHSMLVRNSYQVQTPPLISPPPPPRFTECTQYPLVCAVLPQVWDAKDCVVIKRSMATGYAGLDNPVFYKVRCAALRAVLRSSLYLARRCGFLVGFLVDFSCCLPARVAMCMYTHDFRYP